MGRTWRAQIGHFECDYCHAKFEKKTNKIILARSTHYCNMTCFRHGNRAGGATDEVRKRTYFERYGVEHPMLDASSSYRQKRDKTCLDRYGTTVPTKSTEVKSRTRVTNTERYGVPFPMMNSDVKARMIEALKQNDMQAIAVKRLETMKRNGSFKKSRAEDKMYALLLERFEASDIERNRRPDGTAWPIDFYVKSIDTWIQVDGVYWHGIDGQIENHRQNATTDRRSKIIVYKWETDKRQVAWFAERSMRLIRITDKDVYRATKSSGGSNALIELGIIAASGSVSSHVEPQRSHAALQPANG